MQQKQHKHGFVLHDPQVINAVSGALAGALTATFVCPLDVLKTRLQIQRIGSVRHGGIIGGLAHIVRCEGARGLYQGLGPTLMALLPNWAVYFTVYDKLKHSLSQRSAARHHGGGAPPPSAAPLIHMAAAAGAGVATLLVTNPLWVVKTRMQTQHMGHMGLFARGGPSAAKYTGTFNALLRIGREEGLRGLYSGLAPSLMGILHVAIQFPLYETSKVRLAEHRCCRADELTASELVAASALSKMVASTVTYPHEVVRSYMHVTGSGPWRGLMEACRTIWREDGMRGFYRGCATNLLRTTPAAALTFTSFELIARGLKQMAAAQQLQEQQENNMQRSGSADSSTAATGAAAGSSSKGDSSSSSSSREGRGGAYRMESSAPQQAARAGGMLMRSSPLEESTDTSSDGYLSSGGANLKGHSRTGA